MKQKQFSSKSSPYYFGHGVQTSKQIITTDIILTCYRKDYRNTVKYIVDCSRALADQIKKSGILLENETYQLSNLNNFEIVMYAGDRLRGQKAVEFALNRQGLKMTTGLKEKLNKFFPKPFCENIF